MLRVKVRVRDGWAHQFHRMSLSGSGGLRVKVKVRVRDRGGVSRYQLLN